MKINDDQNNLTKVKVNDENISAFNDSEYARGEHPNSLKNLKPFPKGVSGNPLGKPHKYKKLADRLNKTETLRSMIFMVKNPWDIPIVKVCLKNYMGEGKNAET